MTSRREFLQSSVSVSSLPLALSVALPAGHAAADTDTVPLYKVVYDDRYAEGRLFAAAAGQLGTATRSLDNGDVTAFWYDELDLLWRERPAAIAGLTQFGPMFVLERLARERGMGIALRVEHRADSDGTMTHVIAASPETVSLAAWCGRQSAEWPVLVATLAAHCTVECESPAQLRITTPGSRPEPESSPAPESVIHYYLSASVRDGQGVPWDGPLYSWVIASGGRI